MQYVSLKKIHHIDERKCNEVYLKRFESESSRKLGIHINDYECFYVVNEEMLKLMTDIYTINNWVERISNTEEFSKRCESFLKIKSLIVEIGSSNKMEGIHSTRKELAAIIESKHSQKHIRFWGMVKKYQWLMNNEFSSIQSCTDIRELYDEILLEDVMEEDINDQPDGVIFRKEAVVVDSGSKVIHTGVLGEKNIIEMMDKSLRILNDDSISLLIRVAIFHYLFGYIHPFYNGNGRMARFLSTSYLSTEFNSLCAFQVSIACNLNHRKYEQAFQLTNDIRNKADLTPFIINFLEIYLSGLQEFKEKTEETISIYCSMKNKVKKHTNKKYHSLLILLLESTLFGVVGMTMDVMVAYTNKTEQTLRSMIKEINKEYPLISINDTNKPYNYQLNLDIIASFEE